MRFYGDWFARPKFAEGNLKLVPWPHLTPAEGESLREFVLEECELRRRAYRLHEPYHEFTAPSGKLPTEQGASVTIDWGSLLPEHLEQTLERAYGLDADDAASLVQDVRDAVEARTAPPTSDPDTGRTSESVLDTSDRAHCELKLSYALGVGHGRWDVRIASGERPTPRLPGPFDPLLVCPPGMLQGSDGLPYRAEHPPSSYPIQTRWDGIVVDDPDHPDDILRRVRETLAVMDGGGEDFEAEARQCFGVRDLRAYFRKPGHGGFWMDHVRRYSKSRRKAPIYWYLRSSKGNYGLWLYYHRLDKDTLFKALQNYVEPRIQLGESRLSSLRAQQSELGSAGREAKQAERDVDRQEQFLSELYDFRDKMRRAADLRIDPNLNDGVVLNIAPLWELVPWKEAKKHWDALEAGKYDWSHIAYQLWPERVEEICKTDRSVAIAHGREDLCEANP
jgi:hypothetical protein